MFFTQCSNEQQSSEQSKKNEETKISSKEKKDIHFNASSEKIAEVGEIFQVKYEVNQEAEDFTPPDFSNFDVISGPMTSSFSSFQIINGKSSKTYTNSYTYNISCSKPGTYTIKPAKVVVDGETYKSNSLQIKITGSESKTENENKVSNTGKKKIHTKEDIFIRTDLSKTSVYNGEFITATTKIYTRTDFQNISEIKFPDYSGFWTKKLQEPRQIKFHNELINGKKYSVALLKQTLLFAVKPGRYTINPYEISLQIKKKDGKARDFFGNIVDNYKLINKRLKTQKYIIVVKPLPEPIPQNFSGFTGKDVSVKAEIDTHIIKTDESADLKITVSGTGNLYMLTDLKLDLPENLKHFKPETELNDKYDKNGENGDRIFNFIITAEKKGNYQIPSVDFVYFNSKYGKYKTVTTKPIDFHVTKGTTYNSDNSNENVVSNKDIRYIKEKSRLKKVGSGFVGSVFFRLLYLVLALLFVLIIYFRKKYIKINADISAVRKKKAGKISQKRLKRAAEFMKAGNENEFYREILDSIWGYLKDKMSVNADSLTTDTVEQILRTKSIDKNLIDSLLSLVDECGYAQYSTASEGKEMNDIYNEAARIINELEHKLS